MIRTVALALALALAANSVSAATKCTDPKTHKFIKCPPAAAAVSSAPASHAPHCVKGKVCGNTCIAMNKQCHIK